MWIHACISNMRFYTNWTAIYTHLRGIQWSNTMSCFLSFEKNIERDYNPGQCQFTEVSNMNVYECMKYFLDVLTCYCMAVCHHTCDSRFAVFLRVTISICLRWRRGNLKTAFTLWDAWALTNSDPWVRMLWIMLRPAFVVRDWQQKSF